MKILHICLANFYLEGMGYQENILPAYHVKDGHDVYIFTSEFVFDKSRAKNKDNYINDFGAKVYSIKNKYHNYFHRFKIHENLYDKISEISPDIIFVHGGQFISLNDVIKYAKNHHIKLYIDQHADYYNTPVKTLKQKLAANLLFGKYMRKAVEFTEKFWGVTPWRCQYLNDVYGIPQEKIGLLTMGGDDDKINFNNKDEIRASLRNKLGLSNEDFVIISGGKINRAKNIHLLMSAVSELNLPNVKLIVFGNTDKKMKEEIENLAKSENIHYINWISADKVYDYFLACDLAVFPGTHSVLWEQACACGLPALFKHWEGMKHVNINGNCDFLYEDSKDEIALKISELITNEDKYKKMKQLALECKNNFFYSEIAKKSIQ